MTHFHDKDGCGGYGCCTGMCVDVFKEELAWSSDEWLRVISNLKQV